ncbi:MAG: single-stranded-DNA-specific exonuclease RecJ [Alphaproteobacteria bacterium]|nr:MAG: single-stranded-DNA-specific exonuclease RecJ [Alphaproteobacteria bacterium]
MTPILSQILEKRNITDIESFLDPKLKDTMRDPLEIPNMREAADRFIEALENKQKIGIFGDYDVDGGTSVALLMRVFKDVPFEVYIPNRLTEGYGPNKQAMDYFKDKGVDLVVFVDCGTQAIEVLEYAKGLGLDLIVLDHHVSHDPLCEHAIIVNPNAHADVDVSFKNLCAAGVTFLFITVLVKKFPGHKNILLQNLDLVALGTVCDIMPLLGLNRAIVKQGLKVANLQQNHGITALSSISGIEGEIKSEHFGFHIGPRINAGGRTGRSDFGYKILSTNCQTEAILHATELNKLNTERKDIQQTILDEAIEEIERKNLNRNNVLLLGQQHWHPGVIGVVAGRIKDIYHKPALIVGFNENALGIGSGRSPDNFSVLDHISEATKQEIILGGGGHACAFGFKLTFDQLEPFHEFLIHKTKELEIPEKTHDVDVELESFEFFSHELVQDMAKLEPFGHKNPEPVFRIKNVILESFDILKGRHFKGIFRDQNGRTMKGMCFDFQYKYLSTDLEMLEKNTPVEIIVRLSSNEWMGQLQLTLHILDLTVM